jgi:hypothetical protein
MSYVAAHVFLFINQSHSGCFGVMSDYCSTCHPLVHGLSYITLICQHSWHYSLQPHLYNNRPVSCTCSQHDWVLLLPFKRQQTLRTQILPKILGGWLYAYLHPLLVADKVSGLVMPAYHYNLWLRWSSPLSLRRLWHTFCWVKIFDLEISLQFHKYLFLSTTASPVSLSHNSS